MADAYTVSRLGEAYGGSSDAYELFLKTFSGEVLAAFEERNIMMPLHTVRTITSGKSAQFPMTGVATASYHVPGNELTGASLNHAERVISIDNLLVSQAFVANIDEAKSHWDVRSEYTRQMGFALANAADTTLINYGFAGARATTDRFGNTGSDATPYLGTKIDIGDASNGAHLLAGIVDAAQTLDEQNVPANDRFCVLAPSEYYLLV